MKAYKPVKTIHKAKKAVAAAFLFHEYCKKWPIYSDEKLAELAQSIKQTGLESDIIYAPNRSKRKIIIDGRNRLIACEIAGVKPRLRLMRKDQTPIDVIMANNLHRRHLDFGKLVMIAADLMLLEQERLNPGGGKREGDAREKAAKATGVSPRSVSTAARLQRDNPELAQSVRDGDLTLNAADVAAKMDQKPEKRPSAEQLTFGESFGLRRPNIERMLQLIPGVKNGQNFRNDPKTYREDVAQLEKALNKLKSWDPKAKRKKCPACSGTAKIEHDGASHKCLLCDNGHIGAAS